MAVSSFSLQTKGYTVPMQLNASPVGSHLFFPKRFICPTKRVPHQRVRRYQAFCSLDVAVPNIDIPLSASINSRELIHISDVVIPENTQRLVLMDLDPGSAKLAITILGPFLSVFSFLFIIRIVMSWYPKLPVGKFPYVIAYAPTEPILTVTRKVIPPLGGVDVTPVVWFGLISFLNEILVGPQGLLVLLSQQV
ncbi:protein COFACTOR ASSEMBLY OF COMPLEX C SUBUNIT B CCB3, chloroplastic isoform X4 [Helianthus annuus]|uniref:protein COFACTOR ASSEMBLY OF COMPLEX C SUBUNIT B CCB3, chloroplastic isoform X4 n=1 Tax=Helianthus annuus TaxID=4232 RepID=UPI000B905216|nr:protein COFACTOR ASSEMBLY OF COMPLEX C SUBUNIT B CCB3, chloroplastic isoform X4 [Helianthus annuus]